MTVCVGMLRHTAFRRTNLIFFGVLRAFATQTALQSADSTSLALPIMPAGSRCIARYCLTTALVQLFEGPLNGLADGENLRNFFGCRLVPLSRRDVFGRGRNLNAPLLMHLGEEDEFISKAAQAELKAAHLP